MRLIASLAVGVLLLSACSSGDADVDADGTTSTSASGGADSTVVSAAVAGDADVDADGEPVPPVVAVSTAIEGARRTPAASWLFTTTVDFQDRSYRQTVAADRQYDRSTGQSRLKVDIDENFGEGEAGPFAGRTTEVARLGDRVYVRGSGPAVSDDDWYELGEAALEDLVAWNYLFVDPLGERIPLLALLDDDDAQISVGTADGEGTWTYPITLDGEEVLGRLRDEAPAITGWLPADLDITQIDADAGGTVRIDSEGRLLGVRVDLSNVVRAVADTVSEEYEQEFYRSALVDLDLTFDPDAVLDIGLTADAEMVPPAQRLGEEQASELVPGDCLPTGTDLRQTTLPLVACDAAHTFEVFEIITPWSETDEYPGRAAVREEADLRCADAFEGYVGVEFDESVHSVAAISPLPEGWDEGNRDVVCLAESYLPRRGLLANAGE